MNNKLLASSIERPLLAQWVPDSGANWVPGAGAGANWVSDSGNRKVENFFWNTSNSVPHSVPHLGHLGHIYQKCPLWGTWNVISFHPT